MTGLRGSALGAFVSCAFLLVACGGGTSGAPAPLGASSPTAVATPGTGATAVPSGAGSAHPGASSGPVANASPTPAAHPSASTSPAPSSTNSSAPSGDVTTTSGTFTGATSGSVTSFKGIPYAAPPTGNLRWADPQPVTPIAGVTAATAFGKACEQSVSATSLAGTVILSPPASDQSEDCLYLNVYAPSGLSGKHPVVVWIYGGAYEVGYGDPYDGTSYADNGIVAVTLNYRLSIFGFFSHPGLDMENSYHSSGNQGMLDQLAALKWVKSNIAQFGGDPSNVTIEGESAGAGSVGSLLTSPLSTGLFHQAILESTYALWHPQPTAAQAEATLSTSFAPYGESIATLRSLPAATVLADAPADKILGDGMTNLYDPTNYGPIVDGYYQTDTSLHLWRNKQFKAVNTLIGTCDNEGYIFTSEPIFGIGYPQYYPDPAFQSYVSSQYGSLAMQALAAYPVPGVTDGQTQIGNLFGDTWFQYGTRQIARSERDAGSNVYRYVFTRTPPNSTSPETHGCEIDFVWPGATVDTTPTDTGAPVYTLLFNDTFSRFIKTGNPNGGSVTNWPAFDASDSYLLIGNSGNLPMMNYRQAALDVVDQYSQANLP